MCSLYGGFGTETLKILALNWRDISHPEAGGAEIDIHKFAHLASRWGHEVTLFTARRKNTKPEEEIAGYRVIRGGNRFTVYLAARLAYRARFWKERFDVILDDINGVPWFTPLYARQPVVALLNHIVGRTFFQELPAPLALMGWLAEASIPHVYRNVHVMVRTETLLRELSEAGYAADTMHIVHSGLDHETYRPDGEKGAVPTVIFVGPIKTYKHPETALLVVESLLRDLPSIHLDVVGWDRNSLSRQLVKVADRLGIRGHVTFHGRVSESEKVRLLQRAWLLIQPSEREGWSYAILEAAACGTPAVATSVGGMRESVRQGISGILVPYGDEDAMTWAVRRILCDTLLRKRLAQGARKWAGTFSWERYTREVLAVLRHACS